MNSPGPTEIQAHLFSSFIEGRTADVALRIKGTWSAIYKLHKVVLIQAVRAYHPRLYHSLK